MTARTTRRWPPIPLAFAERVALAKLRLLVMSGFFDPEYHGPAVGNR
jgi:hypothetical protein